MRRRIVAALLVASLGFWAEVSEPSMAAGTVCANLAALTIPDVAVNRSTLVPAGSVTPSHANSATVQLKSHRAR